MRRAAWVAGLAAVLVAGLPSSPALAAPSDEQWYLDTIKAPAAQQISRGAGVTIGLLTATAPYAHPDIDGAVSPTHRLGFGELVVEAPAGFVTDGTATAEIGLMVARGGTGRLLGVAPEATVQPFVCGLGDDVSRCMRWLVDHGAGVIDVGHPITAQSAVSARDGIRYALAHDVVVVAGAGDAARLGGTSGVLVVGGVTQKGELPNSSAIGSAVDVRAPGGDPTREQFIGLNDASGYASLVTVTSDQRAASLVAGVVALVRSKDPKLSAPSVINRILRTATDAGDPGKDTQYGYGVVNAEAAVSTDTGTVATNPLGDPGEPGSAPIPSWVYYLFALLVPLGIGVTLAVVTVVRQRRRRAAYPYPMPR